MHVFTQSIVRCAPRAIVKGRNNSQNHWQTIRASYLHRLLKGLSGQPLRTENPSSCLWSEHPATHGCYIMLGWWGTVKYTLGFSGLSNECGRCQSRDHQTLHCLKKDFTVRRWDRPSRHVTTIYKKDPNRAARSNHQYDGQRPRKKPPHNSRLHTEIQYEPKNWKPQQALTQIINQRTPTT